MSRKDSDEGPLELLPSLAPATASNCRVAWAKREHGSSGTVSSMLADFPQPLWVVTLSIQDL